MPQQYTFLSHWKVNAPIEKVWQLIYDSEKWPSWWTRVISVQEIHQGDERGIGTIRKYKMRSPMLYTLTFDLELTERIDMQLLKGNASGDLIGMGEWLLMANNTTTDVKCLWNVSTTKWWMNIFAFILRPVFHYNHAAVMREGANCMAQVLNKEVLVIS